MMNRPTALPLLALLMGGLCMQCGAAADIRRSAPSAAAVRAQAQQAEFNRLVLQVVNREMPRGGGYAGAPADVARLAEHGVVWVPEQRALQIRPRAAVPTFCSAACYMVLLKALQQWESNHGLRLPAAAWQALDVHPVQPDGHGAWGRANANGPGFAKLVHDLRVGVNFSDIRLAQPGDFLKIFWSGEIGAHERGHLVIYLGTERKKGGVHLRYWSANKPGGYGVKTAPLSRMHNLIFTRITTPQNFVHAHKLPATDTWLSDMQQRRFSFDEVRRACGVH